MMTKEVDDGAEFWLPPDFLTDDLFTSEETTTENEGDDVKHSFHGENKEPSVLATSPQSTLCGIGRWSFNSNGSPDGNSLVSSPPSTPFPKPRDDSLDLLYAAAGQVERLTLKSNDGGSRAVPIKNQGMHLFSDQDLIQHQLQAARFYQLKRQQLLRIQQQQKLNAVWGRQQQQQQQVSRAVNAVKPMPLGLSSSAWPPLQQGQQPQPQRGSGMTAVFLNGGRRQSAGTGVFLPRRSGTPAEPRKKQTRSTVLLPARVVQALNLNLEDMEVHPRAPNTYVLDSAMMMGRSNMKRNKAAAAVGASSELRLPPEWTY